MKDLHVCSPLSFINLILPLNYAVSSLNTNNLQLDQMELSFSGTVWIRSRKYKMCGFCVIPHLISFSSNVSCFQTLCVCVVRWSWSVSYRKASYTTRSTPSSTTGESMTRSLDWPSKAQLMPVPLTGAYAGPLRTSTKVCVVPLLAVPACVNFWCLKQVGPDNKVGSNSAEHTLTWKSSNQHLLLFPYQKIWAAHSSFFSTTLTPFNPLTLSTKHQVCLEFPLRGCAILCVLAVIQYV